MQASVRRARILQLCRQSGGYLTLFGEVLLLRTDVLLEPLLRAPHFALCPALLLRPRLCALDFLRNRPMALFHRLELGLDRGLLVLQGKNLFGVLLCRTAKLFDLALSVSAAFGGLLDLKRRLLLLKPDGLHLFGELFHPRLTRLLLRCNRLTLFVLRCNLLFRQLNILCGVAAALFKHRSALCPLGLLGLGLRLLRAQLFGLHLRRLYLKFQLFSRLVSCVLFLLRLLQVGLRRAQCLFSRLNRILHAVQRIHPERYLMDTQLIVKNQILFCGLRLFLQRTGARLQLIPHITDAREIVVGLFQTLFRLALARAELGDAGRLLKDLAAVDALGG